MTTQLLLTEELTKETLDAMNALRATKRRRREEDRRSGVGLSSRVSGQPANVMSGGSPKDEIIGLLAAASGLPPEVFNHEFADAATVRDSLYGMQDLRSCTEIYLDNLPRIASFIAIFGAVIYSYPPTGIAIKAGADLLRRAAGGTAPAVWHLVADRYKQYLKLNPTGGKLGFFMKLAREGFNADPRVWGSFWKSFKGMSKGEGAWRLIMQGKNLVITVGVLAYLLAKVAGGTASLIEDAPDDADLAIKGNKDDFTEIQGDNPYYLRSIEQLLESLFLKLEVVEYAIAQGILGKELTDPRCEIPLWAHAGMAFAAAFGGRLAYSALSSGGRRLDSVDDMGDALFRTQTSVMLSAVDEIDDAVRRTLKSRFKWLPEIGPANAGFYDDLLMAIFDGADPATVRRILEQQISDVTKIDDFVKELPALAEEAVNIQSRIVSKYSTALRNAANEAAVDTVALTEQAKRSKDALFRLRDEIINRRALQGRGMDETFTQTDEMMDLSTAGGLGRVPGPASEVSSEISESLNDLIISYQKGDISIDEFTVQYKTFWQQHADDVSKLTRFDESGKVIDAGDFYLQMKQVNNSFSRIFITVIDDTGELKNVARRAAESERLFVVLQKISDEEKYLQNMLDKLNLSDETDFLQKIKLKPSKSAQKEIYESSQRALEEIKEEVYRQLKGVAGNDIRPDKLKEASDKLTERIFDLGRQTDSAESVSKFRALMYVSVATGVALAAKNYIVDPFVSQSEKARLHKMQRDMQAQDIDALINTISEDDEFEINQIIEEIFKKPSVYNSIYNNWIFFLRGQFRDGIVDKFETFARDGSGYAVIAKEVITDLMNEKATFDTAELQGTDIKAKEQFKPYNFYSSYVQRPAQEMYGTTGGLGVDKDDPAPGQDIKQRAQARAEIDGEAERQLQLANRWWPLTVRFLILNADIENRIRKLLQTDIYKKYQKILRSNDPEKGKKSAQFREYFKTFFTVEILNFQNVRAGRSAAASGGRDGKFYPTGYEVESNSSIIRKNIKILVDTLEQKLALKNEEEDPKEDPGPSFLEVMKESNFYNYSDLREAVKSVLMENYSSGYSIYPYSSRMGAEEEPKPDYMEDWKALEVSLIRDKTRQTAIDIAKILVKDLELFGDFLDYAGQNQSIGSELLRKLQQNKEKDPKI